MVKDKLGAICEACHLVDPPSHSRSALHHSDLMKEGPLKETVNKGCVKNNSKSNKAGRLLDVQFVHCCLKLLL